MKAVLFPGQGSQVVGMGKNHYDQNEHFREYVNKADLVLGISLSEIMFGGPEDQLRQTEFTQPAIFVHSVALFSTLNEEPDMVAGHSLGEFSALVAAGAIEFEDALAIVRKRGQLMQQAGKINPGSMAAVIGMDDTDVEDACHDASEATGLDVVAANYNCPGQLVISGHEAAVDMAIDLLKERGCKLAKKLPVSGAFHSPLMQPAYEGLREKLQSLKIKTPKCSVYANYTGKPTIDTGEIRSNLLNQLLNPVRWTQTLQQMHKDGATEFTETGPGNVLQGLVKRTLKNVQINGFQ
jgi:[acyl-carrier-protein] S-malonyltransferase